MGKRCGLMPVAVPQPDAAVTNATTDSTPSHEQGCLIVGAVTTTQTVLSMIFRDQATKSEMRRAQEDVEKWLQRQDSPLEEGQIQAYKSGSAGVWGDLDLYCRGGKDGVMCIVFHESPEPRPK